MVGGVVQLSVAVNLFDRRISLVQSGPKQNPSLRYCSVKAVRQ